jgi:hypothetical protein
MKDILILYPWLISLDLMVFIFCIDALAGLGNEDCLFRQIEDWWKRKAKNERN